MKKAFKMIILLILFMVVLLFLGIISTDEGIKRDKILDNSVEFKGYVNDLRTSNNHRFGIIQLKLTESSVNMFNDSLQNGIYPYKIIGDVAEIYTTLSADLDYNDTITLRSKSHEIEFESTKTHSKYISQLHVIEYSGNTDYVKEKTLFE
ncbi:hypothetical protein [uncultured Chryseobacterium sp.]|uniref:hypothetical protein n=1 Tax=uncultured Chryseobacterium sp. TaxID=259322 RepID=UPI0025D9AD94|nr:hypothetical protein [uncultured Chryseobacterium sp.]